MVYNNLVSLQYDCFQKPDWIHIPSKHLPVQINIETLEKGGEICSKLMIKTPTRSTIKKTTTNQLCQHYCSIWADFTHCSGVSIVDFEQVNVAWVWKLFRTPIKMQNLLIPYDFRNIQEWKIPVLESLAEGLQLYLKKDSSTVDFLWILLDFWKHLFYRIPPGDCFSNLELKKSLATSSHTKVLWKIHFVVSIWTE